MTEDLLSAREALVDAIGARSIVGPLVLEAIRSVPRERFVAEEFAHLAYHDGPLPIGGGQTISQPTVVAMMAEAAGLRGAGRVLEIGGGCGYAAAVFGLLAAEVLSIERDATLARDAAARLAALGCRNVTMIEGDGRLGLPDRAPFDAVIVSAAAQETPRPLLEQLAVGGLLVIPIGPQRTGQRLVRIRRDASGFSEETIAEVRFVPLI